MGYIPVYYIYILYIHDGHGIRSTTYSEREHEAAMARFGVAPFSPSGSPSGSGGSGLHDLKQCVDVVGLDGITTRRDHLVLWLTHWGERERKIRQHIRVSVYLDLFFCFVLEEGS